ncbi:MAG: tetratricopeptide repeat protein [Alphaproteobacteria bacterium]
MIHQIVYFIFLVIIQCTSCYSSDLKSLAESGDVKSQFDYGKQLYESGNRDEAAIWINKAAQQDYPEAIFWLGYAMLGDGPEVDYYQKAARLGHTEAFAYVLDNTLFRAGHSADIDTAKEFADLAREKGIENDLYQDLNTVDACYKAGKLDHHYESQYYPGTMCREYRGNHKAFSDCIFQNGGNIDVAELYANGTGVPQNFTIATAYVCHGSYVPAELSNMVNTLQVAETKGNLDKPFSFCDHATATNSMTVCYSLAEEDRLASHDIRLAQYRNNLPQSSQILFDNLQKSANTFFSIRAHNEQDLSGTMRGIFITEEESKQKEWFTSIIDMLVLGKIDKAPDINVEKKHEKLLESLEHSPLISITTLEISSLQQSQKSWQNFIDAFEIFLDATYPEQKKKLVSLLKYKRAQQIDQIM